MTSLENYNTNFFSKSLIISWAHQAARFFLKSEETAFRKKLFIVGGGPSGIELACKIKDIFIDQFEINVIEKSNEILNKNKIFNREQAEKALEKRKINVLLNSKVKVNQCVRAWRRK